MKKARNPFAQIDAEMRDNHAGAGGKQDNFFTGKHQFADYPVRSYNWRRSLLYDLAEG